MTDGNAALLALRRRQGLALGCHTSPLLVRERETGLARRSQDRLSECPVLFARTLGLAGHPLVQGACQDRYDQLRGDREHPMVASTTAATLNFQSVASGRTMRESRRDTFPDTTGLKCCGIPRRVGSVARSSLALR